MGLSCLPCFGEGFGPFSVLVFIQKHPRIVNTTTLKHPAKLLELLVHSNALAVQQFCDALDEDCLVALFIALLEGVKKARIVNVLVPLLNTSKLHETLLDIVPKMDPHCMAEIIDQVPAENISIFLQTPSEKLSTLVDVVQTEKIPVFLIAVLLQPTDILLRKVVPFLRHLSHPGRLGLIINRLNEPDILLWFLCGDIEGEQLAAVIDTFNLVDFERAEHVLHFLQQLTGHQTLVETKILPLLKNGNLEKIVQLVHGMPCHQLLEVLQRVDTDGILRLMENTNANFIIEISNLLGEAQMATIAQKVAGGMRHSPVQTAVHQSTNVVHNAKAEIDKTTQQGTLARGGSRYEFGDFSLGLMINFQRLCKARS